MAQLEEVKKILRSLLVSAPVRVTVSSLNKDFKNLEGCYIPHRLLGYNSLLHMLHSIPDVLRVNGSSMESEVTLVLTEKVAHVSDMVMRQKRPSKGRNARAPCKSVIRAPPSNSRSFAVSKSRNDFAGVRENRPSTSNVRNLNGLSPSPRPLLLRNVKPPCFTKRDSENFHETNLNDSYNTIESGNSTENDSSTSYNVEDLPRVPCLSKHMPHANQNKQPKSVQSRFEKLKLRTLRTMNEYNNNKTENKQFSRSSSEDEGILIIERVEDTKVPSDIQIKLKKLIKQYPSGVRCTDLPALYKQKYFKSLDYQKYGFDRLISLCVYLENIFHYERESDCDYKLYDVENPPLKKIEKEEEKEDEVVFPTVTPKTVDLSKIKGVKTKDWDTYADLIPQDSIILGEVIDNTTINGYKVGDNIQIVVSEILNPSKFWIYKDDGLLNEMMDNMQIFYGDHKQNYVIPEFLLEVGLYCVVHTLNEFQRAIIVDLLHEIGGYVKVYLIDFGTLTNLPREQVWFLSKKFCSLPSQAVETSLAGIRPKDGAWSRQSVLRLKDMVTSKHVFGKVIDNKDGVVSMHTAVSSMPLQTLNDLLVQEGFAEYIANGELQSSTSQVTTVSEEKNPRKKMIERLKLRRSLMKNSE